MHVHLKGKYFSKYLSFQFLDLVHVLGKCIHHNIEVQPKIHPETNLVTESEYMEPVSRLKESIQTNECPHCNRVHNKLTKKKKNVRCQ